MKFIYSILVLAGTSLLFGCSTDPNDPGLEYAPQMAHAIAFEPFSQVTDTNSEFYNTINVNPGGQNLRRPAAGTIARKHYSGMTKGDLAKDIYQYNIPADSLDYAAKVLTNPIPLSPGVVEEGKVLYGRYCQACHGEGGLGDGKVADQYKGVANLVAKSKTISDGHIYHVITYGVRRMWPHGSQVNPDERWKIVHYVKSLGNTPQ
ncbi:MAG TPA: cytochrome c [Catalimonadaceae bacterium]|nr:cytochrome c [Catalimonadaceae bacterium]